MDRLVAARHADVSWSHGHRRLPWPYLSGIFRFRGGKGVATAFGAIAPIGWDLTGLMTGTGC